MNRKKLLRVLTEPEIEGIDEAAIENISLIRLRDRGFSEKSTCRLKRKNPNKLTKKEKENVSLSKRGKVVEITMANHQVPEHLYNVIRPAPAVVPNLYLRRDLRSPASATNRSAASPRDQKEIDKKEIQEKIRETQAKLAGTGGRGRGSKAKYRRARTRRKC